jgi:hypothetical protein
VRETEEIDGALTIFQEGLQRGFGTVVGEIAEERIAGAEGQEAQGDVGACSGVGEDAVEEFVSGAVAAYGDEAAIALGIGFASERGGVTGSGRGDYVNVEAFFAQARDGRAREFAGAAAACGGVDDGEEGFSHAIRTLRKELRLFLRG